MENLNQLKQLLVASDSTPKQIVITAHRNPDGDAIGSSLALYHFLQKYGHHIHVIFPSEFPDFVAWMPGSEKIVIYDNDPEQTEALIKDAEMIFCLDFNSLSRIDKVGEIIARQKATLVMIDHHLDPDDFADYVLSDPKSSSTCELIYVFMELLGKQSDL
ncbi:MAG: DHH family phosphoesterase, partial [Bacteroidota bacterium]